MSFTPLKLAFVKSTRPELEGVELEAAVNAVSDAEVCEFALNRIQAVESIKKHVKENNAAD